MFEILGNMSGLGYELITIDLKGGMLTAAIERLKGYVTFYPGDIKSLGK